MRVVIQKVSEASVKINGCKSGKISQGLVVFIAVTKSDDDKIMQWMCNKIVNLRVFPDDDDKMNLSVLDSKGSILFISNFTLYGDVRKGFRPNFMRSAKPEISEPMYDKMLRFMKEKYPIEIESGEFGAMMDVHLVNDGPVTVIIEKEND